MILVIDNYDSFTYNLVHYLNELGADTVVHRNDDLSVQEALGLRPNAVLLSPGPKALIRPASACRCCAARRTTWRSWACAWATRPSARPMAAT
jgi:anthranilate/para-aminobenzoate synthase component II